MAVSQTIYVITKPTADCYQEFTTHLLFSSLHLRFSEAQKKSILQWATGLGAKGVPSLYSLRKTQERIKALLGDPTEKVVTNSGNIFYLNSVSNAIAKVCDTHSQ